jgi:hypothetical protein
MMHNASDIEFSGRHRLSLLGAHSVIGVGAMIRRKTSHNARQYMNVLNSNVAEA